MILSNLILLITALILLITAMVIAWQAWETRKLTELTKIKDSPLLEVEFQRNGAKLELKNIGQSPAYSPSISSIIIASNEQLDFDPTHSSQLPMQRGESREVWMHHHKVNEGSSSSFVDSTPFLKNFLVSNDTPTKITLRYFDKDGVKLCRDLYIKVSGNRSSGNQQIYTTIENSRIRVSPIRMLKNMF